MQSDDLQVRWWALEERLMNELGKKPDLNALLMLIGVQETGLAGTKFTKEQKQDLMHVGICTVLQGGGYYKHTHTDADGWPHFEQLKNLPIMNVIEQENFLKDHAIFYFEQNNN
jgi:hypothetical protein